MLMPIFDYECRDCGHRFDLLQKVDAAVPAACPSCGKGYIERCLSAPSFQLRGGDWRKGAAKPPTKSVRRVGHTLDSAPAHSHDDHHHDVRPTSPPKQGPAHGGPDHDRHHGHKH